MAKDILKQGSSLFEQIKQIDENGNEFWYARQLAKALEYADFSRNFVGVKNKAKEACFNSCQGVSNHLVEADEVVPVGSGASYFPFQYLNGEFDERIEENLIKVGIEL
jgi:DNA-damage-inducible protein D